MKQIKRVCSFLLLVAVLCSTAAFPAHAAEGDKTYTVTANMYVPGELNTQLPGVTAYITNGNNPLGLGGYEATAPTTPVKSNATLTVCADGTVKLYLPIPNPVFTLQSIGGCSNATILSAPRDSETYATQDGSASRDGRITSVTLELLDQSGTYVFTSCTEFPTLLGVDWTVPLTLDVDFTGVDFTVAAEPTTPSAEPTPSNEPAPSTEPTTPPTQEPTSAPAVNFDKLNAVIRTVEQVAASAIVSEDGSDVEPSKTWTTKAELDTLNTELGKAKAALSAVDQDTADEAASALTSAYDTYKAALKSGKKQAESENLGKTLAPGTYTVSANIWFNKADTGLPLNPHLTNSTFPPYNPVPDNAELTINEDGSAQLVIPISIQDKVMTLRELRGVTLLDSEKREDGAITSVKIDLGQLSGESTVVSGVWEADIEMGDLAMSISGLEKPHTWPAQFELNLSGVATTDGGTMPTVELTLMDASAATEAMANVQGSEPPEETAPPEESPEPENKESGVSTGAVVAIVVAIVVIAVAAAVLVMKKKKGGKK